MRVRFQFRRYRLPFRVVVRTAHGPWAEREGVVIRLENSDGRVGYGEAAPIPWFGTESVNQVESACRSVGEWTEMETLAGLPTQVGCLIRAVGMATDDIASHEAAVAVGGAPSPDWGVAALLPAGHAALSAVANKVDAGFRVFKWKVGVSELTEELGLLDELCGSLPDGARLRLDANGAWTLKQASRWLDYCAERPVEFVEQPISANARGAQDILLGLANDFPTPIALDESLVTEGDIERWAGCGWRGIYVVKPSLLAHPRVALQRLSTADIVFASALETALGARAALQLAYEWTGKRRALGFGIWPLFEDSRFDGPYTMPFLNVSELNRIEPESLWNALS